MANEMEYPTRKTDSDACHSRESGNSRLDACFRRYDKNGFTITETIVVILVLATLASVALMGYNKTVLQAHERAAYTKLRGLEALVKIYKQKNGAYPYCSNCCSNDSKISDCLGMDVDRGSYDLECTFDVSPDSYHCEISYPHIKHSNYSDRKFQLQVDPSGIVHCSHENSASACPSCTDTECPY